MVQFFKKFLFCVVALIVTLAPMSVSAASADKAIHKPFIYAYTSTLDLDATAQVVRDNLTNAGFIIAGEYSPYDGVLDIAVTNAAMQAAAAETDFGSFAAVQRVSITENEGEVQVTYTNPIYMAIAYRLNSEMEGVRTDLEAALGAEYDYGSRKGVQTKKLKNYRYMGFPMFTERFDQPDLLATYESHELAVAAVEAGLATVEGGVSKVYRVDVADTSNTLFGVSMTAGCSGDTHIMNKIDFEKTRSSAHLPYEVLVKDNEVYALGARFRIAISFPDLKMVGSHSFAGIMCAPGDIKNALRAASGNPK